MKKDNKKGFTLIELLVTIAILALILSLSFGLYNNYRKSSLEKIREIEKQELVDTAKTYYTEFSNDPNYVSYTTEEDGEEVTYSCISVNNLIDKGFYNKNSTYVKELIESSDKTAIKVKTVNGVSTYQVINNYKKDTDCTYWDFNKDVDDVDMSISTGESGNNAISVIPSINKNEDGSYNLKLKFSAEKKLVVEEHMEPVYVMILLDKSGSMISNDKNRNALKAISSMVDDIYTIDNSYIGFIDFGNNANYFSSSGNIWVDASYKTSLLSYINGITYNGDNNYYAAYNKTINDYKIKEKNKDFTYLVLLSDAGNNNDGTTCLSSAQKNNIASTIRDSVNKFIAVAYSPATNCLSTLASSNCPENGGNCYYLSNSAQIETLFENISNNIIESIMSQSVNKSQVNMDFTTKITIYDAEGNIVNDSLMVDFDLNLEDTSEEIVTKEVEYTLKINEIVDEDFTCDYDNNICTYKANLFDGFKIDLYDKNNSLLETLEPSSLPSITITKKLKSYIN